MLLAVAVVSVLVPANALRADDVSDYWATSTITSESNLSFNFEQSVQGSGYHMSYIYAKMGALALKNYQHGSGSIDNEMLLQTYESKMASDDAYNVDVYNESCIQMKEDNVMVYSPMTIAIGTGYYARQPIAFDSLIKEKTWAKNYRAATSMHHEVEYAHALDKELDVIIKEKYKDHTNGGDEIFGVGYTQMKVIEDVTDGKAHFGVLQATGDAVAMENVNAYPDSFATQTAWKNPAIEIDEDYFGTYHIEKNMTLEVPYKFTKKSYDWLPCCFGGFEDLAKKYPGQQGIFDCTCLKTSRSTMYGLPVGAEPFKEWA